MTLVLLYHGVTVNEYNDIRNYNDKHIKAEIFYDQLKSLSKKNSFYSIKQLEDAWSRGNGLPANSVVVTFDDGFLNNNTVAAPILKELDIPSVFYVCTGNISDACMFWVDSLEYAFNLAYNLGVVVDALHPLYSILQDIVNTDKSALRLDILEDNIVVLDSIKKRLKLVPKEQRMLFVSQICSSLNFSPSDFDNGNELFLDYRLLSWVDLQDMDANSLFTVGGILLITIYFLL